MGTIWFLDTNILASWTIIESRLLETLSSRYSYPSEYQTLYYNKFLPDVTFVNALLNPGIETFARDNEVYVSFLATNELFSAIRDEVLSLKLFHQGVPVSRWPGEKNRITLTKNESKLIYTATLSIWGKLFGGNISIIEDDVSACGKYRRNENNAAPDSAYWDISAPLMFQVKNAKTQDIMLLTTAVMNGADYFVTRDERLIQAMKDANIDLGRMKIIKPDTALLLLGVHR